MNDMLDSRNMYDHYDNGYTDAMDRVDDWIEAQPTIDPEGLRPHGRCRYCSPEDGAGVEWDLEDIEVSMTLRCGKLTISNSFGDEADVPIRYCPICGAEIRLEEHNDQD